MTYSIANKMTGEKITWLKTATDTNGQYLKFKMVLAPKGALPVVHVHPNQDETFVVKQGICTLLVDGTNHYIKPGESFTVAKGVPHKFQNESATDEMEMDVTFIPALNSKTLLEQFYGLANDGKTGPDGTPDFLQLMTWVNKYEVFVAGPPLWVQKLLGYVLGSIGGLVGYRNFYEKYSPGPVRVATTTKYHEVTH